MQISRISFVYNRLRRRFLSNPAVARIVVLGLALFIIGTGWFFLRRPVGSVFGNLDLLAGSPLPQTSGRTNILILGTGGDGHEGPDLADTIILVSVKLSTGQATLISVPRDIWVPSLRDKINSAYHYGYEKQGTAGGLLLARSAVSESMGQPVHFVVKIDFRGFIKGIDLLGGIDINVDHEFTDDQYPVPGRENDPCDGDPQTRCRYETIHYSAGPQHMDGAAALKFVRSRHSLDPEEGTDFARSKRQEKVISAVREKLMSIKNLQNSKVYKDLFELAQQSVVTDITPQYYSTLFQLGMKIRALPLISYSFEDHLENPPLSSKYDYKWVLIPQGENARSLYDYIASLLP